MSLKYQVGGKTLGQISRESGIHYNTLLRRYHAGCRDYEELTTEGSIRPEKYRLEVACERGRRFLEVAFDKSITMKMIEDRTGIPTRVLWNFIYNDADISSKRLAKICACVGVSMDYVCGLTRWKDGNA